MRLLPHALLLLMLAVLPLLASGYLEEADSEVADGEVMDAEEGPVFLVRETRATKSCSKNSQCAKLKNCPVTDVPPVCGSSGQCACKRVPCTGNAKCRRLSPKLRKCNSGKARVCSKKAKVCVCPGEA